MPVSPRPSKKNEKYSQSNVIPTYRKYSNALVQLPVTKLTRNGRMAATAVSNWEVYGSNRAGCPLPPVKRSAPNLIAGNMQALDLDIGEQKLCQKTSKYSEWPTTPTNTDQICRLLQSDSPSTTKQNSFPEGKEILYPGQVNKTLLARNSIIRGT